MNCSAKLVADSATTSGVIERFDAIACRQLEQAYACAIAVPNATLVSVYSSLNAAAAYTIDALHAAMADHDDDAISVLAIERAVISACSRRAAELVGGDAR